MSLEDMQRRRLLQTVPVAALGLGGVTGESQARQSGSGSASTQEEPTETSDSEPYTQITKLAASDGDYSDEFGGSLAVSADGNTAVIGSPFDGDPNGFFAGSAYVFEHSDGSWTQQQKLLPDDGGEDDNFGWSVAVSGDGNTAIIGAPYDDGSDDEIDGSAYVFERSGGSWTQQQKLAPVADFGQFGGSIALSADGGTAIIGASSDENPSGESVGSAYVFVRSSDSWAQQQKLVADDGDEYDEFGKDVTVSADGSIALVGAFSDSDPNGDDAGSAYVFERSGDSWTQQQKLVPEDGDRGDRFSSSVAIAGDGSTAVIGAKNDDGPSGENVGSAYVFERAGGSWTQQQKLVLDDADENDYFGSSVAVTADGSTIFIESNDNEDPSGSTIGSTEVFERSDDSWTQRQKLVPDDGEGGDAFGGPVGVSADGSIALIGAAGDENPTGSAAGSAYVFSSGSGSPNSPPTADAGSDQTVSAGTTVTLDATNSTDRDGDSLTYSWTQTAGPAVSLTESDTATPEFTAPDVESETGLQFEVTVDDGNATDTDTTSVTITTSESDGPPPVTGENEPTDLDGDGLYEDIDGDGEVDISDVSVLFENRHSDVVQNNPEYFNFSDSDPESVGLADVRALFASLD